MENTLYFKDMNHCDQNNYPKKVYKVEYSKMLIEILDTDHIQGRPFYFSSPHSRDDFIKQIKDHILRINHEKRISNFIGKKADLTKKSICSF